MLPRVFKVWLSGCLNAQTSLGFSILHIGSQGALFLISGSLCVCGFLCTFIMMAEESCQVGGITDLDQRFIIAAHIGQVVRLIEIVFSGQLGRFGQQ